MTKLPIIAFEYHTDADKSAHDYGLYFFGDFGDNVELEDMNSKHLRNAAQQLIQKSYSMVHANDDNDKWAKANLLKAVEMIEVLILRAEVKNYDYKGGD